MSSLIDDSLKSYNVFYWVFFYWFSILLALRIPKIKILCQSKKNHTKKCEFTDQLLIQNLLKKLLIYFLVDFWLVLRIPKSIQKRKWYQNMYISHQMRVAVADIKDGAVRLKFRHFWKIWQIELYRQEI